MPRGRPRKVPVEVVEPNTLQWKIAEVISKRCAIPGCGPKLHLDEASEIIEVIQRSK